MTRIAAEVLGSSAATTVYWSESRVYYPTAGILSPLISSDRVYVILSPPESSAAPAAEGLRGDLCYRLHTRAWPNYS